MISNIDMASLTPFLIWIVCVGIAALAIGVFIKYTSSQGKEGFDTAVSISITACPATTNTYMSSSGDTNCCNGDIVDNRCNGNVVCSLSPTVRNGTISCSEWVSHEWTVRANRFCTNTIPYYFGTMYRRNSDNQGCSASPCTSDGGSPSDPTKPICKIYSSSTDEYGKADSCFNSRYRDAMISPTATSTKNIIASGTKPNGQLYPALFTATFIPTRSGSPATPVTCQDWTRYKLYLDTVDPTGTTSSAWAQNAATNVYFCDAATAYYISGTLSPASATGVVGPGGTPSSAACPALPTGADPRCYYNGVKLGAQNGERVSYTASECSQLGGTFDDGDHLGICRLQGTTGQIGPDASIEVLNQFYSYFCSTDPEVVRRRHP